ncbi:MAG TPA: hypothetical protein DEQ03_04725 [Marinilabiliales bacterium]|nr:hypothetical protein [Marinilabiliales bacterium]
MGRNIRILFLWLAGILMMGHGLIPHHHHDLEHNSCAKENNLRHVSVLFHSQIFETCCGHSNHEPDSVCHLVQKTLVKNPVAFDLAVLPAEQILHIPQLLGLVEHRQVAPKIHHGYFNDTPSRAPPVV